MPFLIVLFLFMIKPMVPAPPSKIVPLKHAQVRITNHSMEERQLRLWGSPSSSICEPAQFFVADLTLTQTLPLAGAVSADGHIAYNPYNGLLYVLGHTAQVFVVTTAGQLVATVPLPVGAVPSALAIITESSHSGYGRVYISNQNTNNVTVIATNLSVLTTIGVGAAPVALALDSSRDRLYVANYNSSSISVIDLSTHSNTGGVSVIDPAHIVVVPPTGTLYVSSKDDSIQILDSQLSAVATLALSDTGISAMMYHPVNGHVYVATQGADVVHPIATLSNTLEPTISIGGNPSGFVYHRPSGLLLVVTSQDHRYVGISPTHQINGSISLHQHSGGITTDPESGTLWAVNATSNTINEVVFQPACNAISIDAGYLEKVRMFQFNPIQVTGIRWVFSTPTPFYSLRLEQRSSTGTIQSRVVPMQAYRSTQHKLPVIDLYGLQGVQIDSQHSWHFTIAPLQVITLLVYYHQLLRTI